MVLGQSQRSGTVPGFWNSPKVNGLSHYDSLRLRNSTLWCGEPEPVPTSQDCPRLLGQSHSPGTVPSFWVSEIVTPLVLGLRVIGTVPTFQDCPGFWDSSKVLGQSQSSETVKGFWIEEYLNKY